MMIKLVDVMSNRKYGTMWGYSIADRVRRWNWYVNRQTKHLSHMNRY